MTKIEAIKAFKNGDICLFKDSPEMEELTIEILRAAKPIKEVAAPLIDNFFWSARQASGWLGRYNLGCTLPVIKVSTITE